MPNGRHRVLDTAAALWPEGRGLLTRRPTGRSSPTTDHLVLPRTSTARWLLPVDAPHTVRAVLGGLGAPPGPGGPTAFAMRFLPWPRLRLDTPHAVSPLLRRLGRSVPGEVAWAIRLSPWDQARNVVLRGFAPDGDTLAYAKVGIDEHGRHAVRAEAAALTTVRAYGLQHTRIPELRDHDRWGELEFLVVSPLVAPRRRGDATTPFPAMLELARADGSHSTRLTEGRWFTRIQHDVSRIVDQAAASLLRRGLRVLAEHASGLTVPMGPWHGDWTPWNMGAPSTEDPRVPLWDWEHFAREVPVGFDLLHHRAQQLRAQRGTTPREESVWSEEVEGLLGTHVGLAPVAAQAVALAYLVEVNVRFTLDRQGAAEDGRRRCGWGLDMVERTAAGFRAAAGPRHGREPT